MFLTLNEKFWVSLIIQDISQILFGSIASYTQCFCLSAIYRYRNLYRPIPITIPIPIYRPIPIPKLYRSHTGCREQTLRSKSPLRRHRTSNCVQYSCVSTKQQYRGWPQQQQLATTATLQRPLRCTTILLDLMYTTTTTTTHCRNHFEAEAYFREALYFFLFFLGLDE